MNLLEKTLAKIGLPNREIGIEAQNRLDTLLKPKGSLGKLETIAVTLAEITGFVHNSLDKKVIIAFAADHGVTAQGISSFPQEVSTLVAETMASGISGAAVLARHAGAKMIIADVGLAGDPRSPEIISRKIARGTADFSKGPAMTRDQLITAIETGIEITAEAIRNGAELIGTGEVGIGNTTASSAILAAFTGIDPALITGRGAGLNDEQLTHKQNIIREALKLNQPNPDDALDVLAKVGGFEIAAMAGAFIACAAYRVPAVIDGFISGAAALAAVKLEPKVRPFLFASHLSEEPGALAIQNVLALEPMLNMNMRLGEGTGAALAFHIIEAASKIISEMGTFADIGMES